MHPSALRYGKVFFQQYYSPGSSLKVIDIGSQNVNGSLRDVCPPDAQYIGVDFQQGENVDVLLDDPYTLPFDNESVDMVVSSSVFEHSQFFWVLFLEILRILKPGGLFYLNAPSNGCYHRYPVDCWRFYPDSGLALVEWGRRSGYSPLLLESFIGEKFDDSLDGFWNDFIAVFLKDKDYLDPNIKYITQGVSDYRNASSEVFQEMDHKESVWMPDCDRIKPKPRFSLFTRCRK